MLLCLCSEANPRTLWRSTKGSSVRYFVVFLLVVGLVAVGSSCKKQSEPDSAVSQEAGQPITLKVSLYPWIPAAEGYEEYIAGEFRKAHKGTSIDLVIRSFERSDYENKEHYVADLAYEAEMAAAALSGRGDDAQDIIELDTMILAQIVRSGNVAEADLPPEYQFVTAGVEAVQLDEGIWGVPHFLCGYFAITTDPSVAAASNLDEFGAAVGTRTERWGVVGDLDGSWDPILLYLDSARDSDANVDLDGLLRSAELSPSVVPDLKKVGDLCLQEEENTCDGRVGDDETRIELVFARGDANTLVGYSERLHTILESEGNIRKASDLRIRSAKLGSGDHPMLFTDALVTSKSCSERPECAEAAATFIRWYTSPEVLKSVLMTEDHEGKAARYLLPATMDAFEELDGDPLYQALRDDVQGAVPFPPEGVPEAKKSGMRDKVWDIIDGPE